MILILRVPTSTNINTVSLRLVSVAVDSSKVGTSVVVLVFAVVLLFGWLAIVAVLVVVPVDIYCNIRALDPVACTIDYTCTKATYLIVW
jgi:hypothetical protein